MSRRGKILLWDESFKKVFWKYCISSILKCLIFEGICVGIWGLIKYTKLVEISGTVAKIVHASENVSGILPETWQIFLTQVSVTFIVTSLLSILSPNLKIVFWKDLVNEKLMKPERRNFTDLSARLIVLLAFSFFNAFLIKYPYITLGYFAISLIITTELTVKMLGIFYGEERIKDFLVEEKKKQRNNEISRENYDEEMQILLARTFKALCDVDFLTVKDNMRVLKDDDTYLNKLFEYMKGNPKALESMILIGNDVLQDEAIVEQIISIYFDSDNSNGVMEEYITESCLLHIEQSYKPLNIIMEHDEKFFIKIVRKIYEKGIDYKKVIEQAQTSGKMFWLYLFIGAGISFYELLDCGYGIEQIYEAIKCLLYRARETIYPKCDYGDQVPMVVLPVYKMCPEELRYLLTGTTEYPQLCKEYDFKKKELLQYVDTGVRWGKLNGTEAKDEVQDKLRFPSERVVEYEFAEEPIVQESLREELEFFGEFKERVDIVYRTSRKIPREKEVDDSIKEFIDKLKQETDFDEHMMTVMLLFAGFEIGEIKEMGALCNLENIKYIVPARKALQNGYPLKEVCLCYGEKGLQETEITLEQYWQLDCKHDKEGRDDYLKKIIEDGDKLKILHDRDELFIRVFESTKSNKEALMKAGYSCEECYKAGFLFVDGEQDRKESVEYCTNLFNKACEYCVGCPVEMREIVSCMYKDGYSAGLALYLCTRIMFLNEPDMTLEKTINATIEDVFSEYNDCYRKAAEEWLYKAINEKDIYDKESNNK